MAAPVHSANPNAGLRAAGQSLLARCHSAARGFCSRVLLLLLLAPVFLVFEIWQLVISERYLGIKQIARNGDPRELGLSEITAFFWSTGIVFYWAWMLLLLVTSLGRVHGLCLFAISMMGFVLRRGCGMKWVLVILTFEGAMRVGLLFSLGTMAWRHI